MRIKPAVKGSGSGNQSLHLSNMPEQNGQFYRGNM
jgi:hypothetical protein